MEKIKIQDSLIKHLILMQYKLATAESCTGGLIAKYCTDISGSSAWFDRGFVTYSNQSKIEMLGVSENTINTKGAVSQQVVEQMVKGVIVNSNAKVAIAVTGIAGPTGGSAEKPVGTVWVGLAIDKDITSRNKCFEGGREEIREQTAQFALQWLSEEIKK